jgi:signal transduction histidine kinase
LILLLGFLTPHLISKKESSFPLTLKEKIGEIQNETDEIFNQKQTNFMSAFNSLNGEITKEFNQKNISYLKLNDIINQEKYEDYSIEIFTRNKNLFVWNSEVAVNEDKFQILNFAQDETFFLNGQLTVYLTAIHSIKIGEDYFYILLAKKIEQYYHNEKNETEEINFTKELEDKFQIDFYINYTSYKEKSKDGRKYSFDLLNNKNNKIGLITFEKPALESETNSISDLISDIQTILIILGLLFIGLTLRSDYKQIKFKSIKFFLFTIYLVLLRWIIFKLGFPSNFFEGELTNPNYFSSVFGQGIVKSPAEFLITVIFLLIISIKGFIEVKNYYASPVSTDKKTFYLLIPLVIFISLFCIQGLAASVKSVIFDSTLRYFNESEIIPDSIHILMNFTILLLGVAVLLIIISCFTFPFRFRLKRDSLRVKKDLLYLFLITEASGIILIAAQSKTLLDYSLISITILLIFVLLYFFIIKDKKNIYFYIYTTIIASIVTVAYLNHFNSQLERESVKTAAIEVNRPNENLLNFLINESLENASGSNEVIDAFYNAGINFNALSFIIWSKSALKNEPGYSSITLLNKQKKVVGSFSNGIEEKYRIPQILLAYNGNDLKIFDLTEPQNSTKKIFTGEVPIKDNENTLGYVCATIVLETESLFNQGRPSFINSREGYINNLLSLSDLNFFFFNNGELKNVNGNFYPDKKQSEAIINSKFTNSEAWLSLEFNYEKYIVYALKNNDAAGEKIIAVALKQKDIEWSLFNFFKVFIIHSIFILIFYIVVIAVHYKDYKTVRNSFRTQLLYAFFIISIIPIIALAVFNRQNVNSKSLALVKNALSEKITLIENQFRIQKYKSTKDFLSIAENAKNELGISFSIYEESKLSYTTGEDLYNAGLFPATLSNKAYTDLFFLGLNEDFIHKKTEDFNYHTLYRKFNFEGKTYLISVNDIFNQITTTLSPVEVDVFLFGVYSLAILLIIIISTLLANRISLPIRKLISATRSVAHGDLSVPLKLNVHGEIKDLVNGFNYMKKELKKNQEDLAELERENAWKEMAKQVAHEIKNPLTPMKLTFQQLIAAYRDKAKNFDTIFEKVSETILNQIDTLNQIASEFSRFARMPKLNLSKFNIIPLISEVKTLFNEEEIKIYLDSKIKHTEIEADQSQFRRILINLIRNSIQANANEIKISLKENGHNYILFIQDNGNGILPDNQGKIFNANFTTKQSGMGIGLKLSKRSVESIGGSLELESSSGKGTTFKIVLPKSKI